jgi:hypothetical protein
MAGSMEQVCVCPRVRLWRWLGKRCLPLECYTTIPGNFWLPLVCLVPPDLVHMGEGYRTHFFGEGTRVAGSVTPVTRWLLRVRTA